MQRQDAVVVGAGPNGLAAAVTLARAGFGVTVLEAADTIGGGTRSAELTEPGLLHDICSAVHPFGIASPFFAQLLLPEHGLEWMHADIALAHPLDDGSAGVLHQSLARTVAGLGDDGSTWERLYGPLVARFDDVVEDLLRPIVNIPRHLVSTARNGLLSLLPATVLAGMLKTPQARALFAGIAAHTVAPLSQPMTASLGLMMGAAGHAYGWPVAKGGSQAITSALASLLESLGGTIETGVRVDSLGDLPPSRVALLDVTPRQALAIAGDRLPAITRRRYDRWRYGPGSFKVDYAVEGGVPWRNEDARRAGTVHVGGTIEEIVGAEREVAAGRMVQRPFVLVAQQSLADPGRARGDLHPVWAYCHVPNGWDGDATGIIDAQIERFAPGFLDRVVARSVTSPQALERYNANYVGGDIGGGATDGLQLLARPRLGPDPYATGLPGLFLCSSSTPPGAGVHGLCGHHAATSALRVLRA